MLYKFIIYKNINTKILLIYFFRFYIESLISTKQFNKNLDELN